MIHYSSAHCTIFKYAQARIKPREGGINHMSVKAGPASRTRDIRIERGRHRIDRAME